MKINRINIGGFKNIENIELLLNNITVLVSPNSYGKSNLLKGIDFGIGFIRAPEKFKRHMMSWKKGIPLNKKIASQNFRIEFELETTIDSNLYNLIYGYEFSWARDDETGKKILNEWLKVKTEEKGQKYNQYIKRTEHEAFYKTSEQGRCNNKILAEFDELIINKLKAFDELFYRDLISEINELSDHIERHLDASKLYEPDPIIRTDMEALEIESSENIPRVLFHLKEAHPDKYDLLINSFIQLFPQITDVSVEALTFEYKGKTKIPKDLPIKVSNKLYAINVVDSTLNQPIGFESLSDGAKRVFVLMTVALLADLNNNSLIAIEELENSIHPSLLQSCLIVLSQLVENCKIIITSHSPYIVQYMALSNVYIGVPDPSGVAYFSKIRKTMEKTIEKEARSLDISVGDYIFELLSGAEDSVEELNRYLEKERHG